MMHTNFRHSYSRIAPGRKVPHVYIMTTHAHTMFCCAHRRPSTSAASGPAATPASAGAPTPKPMQLAQDTQCLLNFLLEGAECEPHKPSALIQQLVQRMQERLLGLPPAPTTAKHLDSCAQLLKKMLAQQVTITAPWDRCVEMMSEVVAAANAGDLDCQRGLIEIHDTVMSWIGSLSYQEAHQQG
jgi:hypothetical protein